MNARATLSNGRTVKENGSRMVRINFEGGTSHFWGSSVFNGEKIFLKSVENKNGTTALRPVRFLFLFGVFEIIK
jgi:hypothetical protein